MNLALLLTELRAETLPLLSGARGALEKARTSGKPGDVVPIRELLLGGIYSGPLSFGC